MSWKDAPIIDNQALPATAGPGPAASRWADAEVVAPPTDARERMAYNADRYDRALGDPGQTRRRDAQAVVREGYRQAGGEFTTIPKSRAAGLGNLLDRQRAWFADPANTGKAPPAELMEVGEDPNDPDGVRVSPRAGSLILKHMETMIGTPNVQEPGTFDDLTAGNRVQVLEDQSRRTRAMTDAGGVPYELLNQAGLGPEASRQYGEALTQPGGVNLGLPEGAINAFTRGSNQLVGDVVGGGGNMIADVTGLEGVRDVANNVQDEMGYVADAFPGSAAAQGFRPGNLRWWTEGVAQQLPNFAAMAAPGMAVGKAFQAMGATARAQQIAAGVTSFSSAAGFEAASAYDDVFKRLRASGASEEDAHAMALAESATIGVINGALERLSFGELFLADHAAMNTLQKAVRGFLAEGSTEAVQEWVPMAVGQIAEKAKLSLPQRQQVEQMLTAALMGGLLGAGAESMQGHGNAQDELATPQQPAAAPTTDVDALLAQTAARIAANGPPAAPGIAGDPAGAGPGAAPGVETGPPLDPTLAPGGMFEGATFEDAPPLDPAEVDRIIQDAQKAAGTTPQGEGVSPVQGEAAPAIAEPDWAAATFEDAPPVTEGSPASARTAQDVVGAPPTAPETSNAPFVVPGEAWGTVHDRPVDARRVARQLAKQTDRPVFLVPTREGGIRLDRRQPTDVADVLAIKPDGTVSMHHRTTDNAERRRASDQATPATAAAAAETTAAPAPRDDGRIDTNRQLGIFATNPDGSPMEVGERPGQVSLFTDTPAASRAKEKAAELKRQEDAKHTTPMFAEPPSPALKIKPPAGQRYSQADPVYRAQKDKLAAAEFSPGQLVHGAIAQDIGEIARHGLRPSGLSNRVDVEKIGSTGKSVGTALSYAGKGGRGDPAFIVLKPGVASKVSDGGANAHATDRIRPDQIAGVVFGDGTRVRWDQAAAYAAQHFAADGRPGTVAGDGKRTEQAERPAEAPGNSTPAPAAGTAGGDGRSAQADRPGQAEVGNADGRRALPGQGDGVATDARPGLTPGAAGAGPANGRAGDAAPRVPDRADANVAGQGADPRAGVGGKGRGGDAPGGRRPVSGKRAAGDDAGKPGRAPGDPVEDAARGKGKGVERSYARRAIQEQLYGELRSEIDARQHELDVKLEAFARPYTFPAGIPTELRTALEGHAHRKAIMAVLSTDVAGGEGNDALEKLGADGYVATLEYQVGAPRRHALELAAREGTPRQQLLAALALNQPRTNAELPTMEHVAVAALPTGTTFKILGNEATIVEPDEGERMLRVAGMKNDQHVEALGLVPADVGTMKAPAELNLDDVEFAGRINRLTADPARPKNATAAQAETTIAKMARDKRIVVGGDVGSTLMPLDAGGVIDQEAKRRGTQPKLPNKRIAPAPLAGGSTKKLRGIIDDFAESIGHRIHQHAKQRKGTGGTYNPSTQRTTIKYSGDLDLTAHELAGHFIDDEFHIMQKWSEPGSTAGAPPFESELVPHFSAYGSRPPAGIPAFDAQAYVRAEGVAEWFRAFIVNPDAAKAAAPIFYAHIRAELPDPVFEQIVAFSDEVRRYVGAPAVQQTLANVDDRVRQKRETLMDKVRETFTADAFKTELLDDRWPIMKAIAQARALRQGVDTEDLRTRNDPATLVRLFAGEEMAIQDAIENGVPRPFTVDRRARGVDGGIAWIMEPLAAIAKDNTLAAMEDATLTGTAFLVNRRVVSKAANWRDKTNAEIDERTLTIEDARDTAIDAATLQIERIRDAMIARLQPGDPGYAMRVAQIQNDATTDIAAATARLTKKAGDAVAKVAKRLNAIVEKRIERMAGIGGGIINDETVAKRALMELAADPARYSALEEFGKRYNATARGLLQYMVGKGRLSRKSYHEILDNNDFYADMHRIVDQEKKRSDAPRPRLGKALGTSKKLVHTMKGSTLEIGNPIVNLMEQVATVIHETDKGYIVERFINLLSTGRAMHDGDAIDFDSIGSPARQGDKDATKYHVKGEEKFFQFRPDIKEAMDSLGNAPELGFILRGVSALVKGLPQAGITKSPPFVVRQLFKDTIQRSMISRTGSGVKEAFGFFTAEEKQRLTRHGGMQAGLFNTAAGWDVRMRDAIEELAKAKGGPAIFDPWGLAKKALRTPGRVWRAYDDSTGYLGDSRARLAEARTAWDASLKAIELRDQEAKDIAARPSDEAAIRAATRAAIVKLGGEKLLGVRDRYDAALYTAGQARELIDYAVKGKAIRRIEPYTMFLNPSIQGPARTLRAVRENPAGFVKRYGALVLLPAVFAAVLRYVGGDEDEYENLPNWQKRFFLNFKLGGRWIAIPQPQELALPRAWLESAVTRMRGDAKAFEGMGEAAAGGLVPFDPSMPLGGIMRGLAENAANWKFFFERSVVPSWEVRQDIELRDTSGASRLGKAISGVLELVNAGTQPIAGQDVRVDPRYIDNMISNMGGGLGQLAMNLSNLGRKDRPASDMLDALAGVSRPTPGFAARDVQAVMELSARLGLDRSKEIQELRRRLKLAADAPTVVERNKLAAEARQFATTLRERWERDESDILTKARNKGEARRAAAGK